MCEPNSSKYYKSKLHNQKQQLSEKKLRYFANILYTNREFKVSIGEKIISKISYKPG